MELDDLKNNWESANNQITNQNILTPKSINEMIQRKYQSKIKKIKYPELIGAVLCFIGLNYIGFNFNKLDTFFLQIMGVLAILLLTIMPVLSFLSLKTFNSANDFDKPYVDIIREFANQKLKFLKYQKINAFLSYLLLVTVIVLLPKFFYGSDATINKSFWIFAFSLGYIFLLFFSKWVKTIYGKSLTQAEKLLSEIEH